MADKVTSIGGLAPPHPTGRPLAARPVATGLRLAAPGTARQVKLKAILDDPNLPGWARDAIQNPNHRRSIGAQIGGVFGGLIPGALHIGKEALVTSIAPTRFLVDAARGDLPAWNKLSDKYTPLASDIATSGEDTAGRLAQLGPVEVRSVGGRKVQTYGDKYRQGDIVGAVLGDVGNLSIGAGAAGKALGVGGRVAEALGAETTAARLGKAANVAETAARLGGRAANAPLEAATGVLKGGESLLRKIGQAGKEGLFKRLPEGEGALGSRLAMAATEEGKLSKIASKEAMTEPRALISHMEENLARDAGLIGGPKAARPSALEQEVGLSRARNAAQMNTRLAAQLGPEAALGTHVGIEEPGVTLTRKGQALAQAYEAGTATPQQVANIDAVEASFRKQSGERTASALEGRGLPSGPMDPAYTGHAPLNEQVTRRLVDSGMSEADAGALRQMVDQGAKWEDLASLAPELGQILLDPQVYPKAWREAMFIAAKGTEAGATGLPRTPEQMLAAGMSEPAYMPTNESRIGQPRGPATVPITRGFGSGLRSVASEHHSSGYGFGRYSLATAAEGFANNISTTEFNHVVQRYVNHAAIPNAAKILDPGGTGILDDLHAQAEAAVRTREIGTPSGPEFDRAVAKQYGQTVLDRLHQQGYDVLPGNRAAPREGDFNPAKAARPEDIGPDSVVLPIGVKDHMVQHRTGQLLNPLVAANTKVNAAFKRNVLFGNLHWTVGDAVSNMLMGWVSGGIDPVAMSKGMMAVKHMAPEVKNEIFNRPSFTATGLRHQVIEALNPDLRTRPVARTKVGRGWRKIQEPGFKANRAVNAIQRMGWSQVKLERELNHRGLSSLDELGSDSAKWADPKVQKAIEDVVAESNKVFGTLDEMSPFEQRVATQLFPFWAWTRHITSLAARTAIDNPARLLWTLRLGAIGMNTSPQDMPDFMRGSVPNPFGEGRINLNWANPLYDVGSGGLFTSAGAAERSLSPLIKFGITAATGRDPARDLNVVSRRPGTDTGLGLNLRAAVTGALGASPFTRGAMNLAPEVTVPGLDLGLGPVRRYGSGQTIIDKTTGQPAPSGPRWRMATNMFNAPLPTSYVPTQAAGQAVSRARRSGLKRQGLNSGRLHRTGLSNG